MAAVPAAVALVVLAVAAVVLAGEAHPADGKSKMVKASPDTIHGVTWAEQQFLQQEIAKAERVTQAEIILGVTKRSSSYDFIALLMAVVIVFPLSIAVVIFEMVAIFIRDITAG